VKAKPVSFIHTPSSNAGTSTASSNEALKDEIDVHAYTRGNIDAKIKSDLKTLEALVKQRR